MSDWWIDESVPPPRAEFAYVHPSDSYAVHEFEDGYLIMNYQEVARVDRLAGTTFHFSGVKGEGIGILRVGDKIYALNPSMITDHQVQYVGRVESMQLNNHTFSIETVVTLEEISNTWNPRRSQRQPLML